MPKVRFTDNYTDHSTEAGYQFEFFCERCGNGYKSGFQASAIGMGSKVARGIGGLLGGGGISNLGWAGQEAKDLTESQAKDKALAKAVQEMEPYFKQCHRCGQWVCNEICWNEEYGLCVSDAPKLEQEIAGMQSDAQLQQVRDKVQQVDFAKDVNVERRQVALCPQLRRRGGAVGEVLRELWPDALDAGHVRPLRDRIAEGHEVLPRVRQHVLGAVSGPGPRR